MTEYWVSYRLHGPTQIGTTFDIGDATLQPGTAAPSVSGTIEFEFEADDREEAEVKARDEYREKASRIAGALAFTFDEGVLLGDPYKIRQADAANKAQMDATLNSGNWELDVGAQVFDNVQSDLASNDRTQRALNWYNIAVSTETDEDRLVAAWTGLVSLAQKQATSFSFSQQERKEIEKAKDDVLDQLGSQGSERYQWVAGHFGNILNARKSDDDDAAVARFATQELDLQYLSDIDDIEEAVGDIYAARNAIVHQGMDVDDADGTADKAEALLNELLMTHLPHAYSNFIGSQTPGRRRYLIEAEIWAPIIFEDDETLELTTNEIRKRAFALCRNLRQAYQLLPDNYAGDDQPLLKISEETFKLNPDYF